MLFMTHITEKLAISFRSILSGILTTLWAKYMVAFIFLLLPGVLRNTVRAQTFNEGNTEYYIKFIDYDVRNIFLNFLGVFADDPEYTLPQVWDEERQVFTGWIKNILYNAQDSVVTVKVFNKVNLQYLCKLATPAAEYASAYDSVNRKLSSPQIVVDFRYDSSGWLSDLTVSKENICLYKYIINHSDSNGRFHYLDFIVTSLQKPTNATYHITLDTNYNILSYVHENLEDGRHSRFRTYDKKGRVLEFKHYLNDTCNLSYSYVYDDSSITKQIAGNVLSPYTYWLFTPGLKKLIKPERAKLHSSIMYKTTDPMPADASYNTHVIATIFDSAMQPLMKYSCHFYYYRENNYKRSRGEGSTKLFLHYPNTDKEIVFGAIGLDEQLTKINNTKPWKSVENSYNRAVSEGMRIEKTVSKRCSHENWHWERDTISKLISYVPPDEYAIWLEQLYGAEISNPNSRYSDCNEIIIVKFEKEDCTLLLRCFNNSVLTINKFPRCP